MAEEAEIAQETVIEATAEDAEGATEAVDGANEGDGAGDGEEAAQEAPEGDDSPLKAEGEAEDDAKPKPKKNPYQRRIDQLNFEKRQLAAERDAALQLRAAGEGDQAPKTYTEADIDRLANERAQTLATQQAKTADFNRACNATFEKGTAAHSDFVGARDNLFGVFGENITPDFLEVINELPNGHDVFHQLGIDLEAASDVFELSPAKRVLRLAQMSADLAKPKGPHIPNLPKPVTPIRGAPKVELDLYDPKLPIDEYVRRRDKQDAMRRQG